jgi:trehalose/maltose hydrolase-like predicted phosphorylase
MVSTTPGAVITIPAQQTVFVPSFNVICTSLNSTDPLSDALALHSTAITNAESLLAMHTAAWAARWDNGRIEVAGDLSLAQAVNASLYFLRASVRDDWPYGTSPGAFDGLSNVCMHTFVMVHEMQAFSVCLSRSCWLPCRALGGLSSDGYNGHSFWDVETWMYPTILMLEPATAEALLEYRYLRRDQAAIIAQVTSVVYITDTDRTHPCRPACYSKPT